MDTDNLEQTLLNITNQAMVLLRDSLNICVPLYKNKSRVPQLVQFVVSNLFTACFSTSESTLHLIGKYRLWDAHMLYRTVLEGTVKLMFVISGTDNEISEKCHEFWGIIPEMKLISRHRKARDLISVYKELKLDTDALRPITDLQLDEGELLELEKAYPRKTRKQMEQKWSFSEMVKTLSSSNEPAYAILVSTFHDYSVGSNLVHMDGDGIGVIWDRNGREPERRISLELAHGARIISSIVSYATIRTELYHRIYELDDTQVRDLARRTLLFAQQAEGHYNKWINIEYNQGQENKDFPDDNTQGT